MWPHGWRRWQQACRKELERYGVAGINLNKALATLVKTAQNSGQDGGELRLLLRAKKELAVGLHALQQHAELSEYAAVGTRVGASREHEADAKEQAIARVLVVLQSHGEADDCHGRTRQSRVLDGDYARRQAARGGL